MSERSITLEQVAEVEAGFVRFLGMFGEFVRLRVSSAPNFPSIEALDHRPGVRAAASASNEATHQLSDLRHNRIAGVTIEELEEKRRNALSKIRDAFRSPAIVSIQEMTNGRDEWQRIILSDPGDYDVEARLTFIGTRKFTMSPKGPIRPVRDPDRRETLFAVYVEAGRKVRLWELDQREPRLYLISPEGNEVQVYTPRVEQVRTETQVEVSLEQRVVLPNGETSAEAPAPPAVTPIEEAAPQATGLDLEAELAPGPLPADEDELTGKPDTKVGKNGKVQVECSACGRAVRVGKKTAENGKEVLCTKCRKNAKTNGESDKD